MPPRYSIDVPIALNMKARSESEAKDVLSLNAEVICLEDGRSYLLVQDAKVRP